jgi:hypothetical protein
MCAQRNAGGVSLESERLKSGWRCINDVAWCDASDWFIIESSSLAARLASFLQSVRMVCISSDAYN